MPRPIRLRKPPSAPSATAKTSTTASTTAQKAAGTTTATVTKSRTTRSGTKDIPDQEPSAGLPTPSSEDVPAKKSTPVKKLSTKVVAVTKRSTRSKMAVDEPTIRTPSPRKQPTTRQRKIATKQKAPEPEKEAAPAPTPHLPATTPSPLPRSSPEIQVLASSDAENHSPQHFASSPPVLPSTPPRVKRRVVLEFDSDAGYSPPPAKQNSAERPRLRELQPVSLEPLNSGLPENPDEEETDDTVDPRGSPTPKRGRKSGFLPPPLDEDEIPTSAQPSRRVAPPPPLGGTGFFLDGDEDPFIIYSDPKSPTPSLPPAGTMDDTMRPPESSPAPTPVKQRKRRSSGAVVDSDEDVNSGDVEDETELAADRKGKKMRGKAQKEKGKAGIMLTSALMDLLPRRKKNTRNSPADEFEILSTSEENQEENREEEEDEGGESEDELSRPPGRTTRSGRNSKVVVKSAKAKGKKTVAAGKGLAEKGSAKNKGKGKTRAISVAPAAVTKSAWSKPLVGKPGKTYARRSIGSEKENDSPNKPRRREEDESGETGSSSDTVVIGDGMVEKQGRRKLKEVAEKFKEVDRWELEFEDVSPRSLEVESEGGR